MYLRIEHSNKNMAKRIKTPAKILGEMLKEARQDAGVTQTTVSKYLGFADGTVLTNIETGKRAIRLWEFCDICDYIKVDPLDMLKDFIEEVPGSKRPKAKEEPPPSEEEDKEPTPA